MSETFVWTSKFRDGINRFMAATGHTLEPVMRDLFGMLVEKAHQWTPPKTWVSGKRKVESDVGRVVKSTESDKLLQMLYRRFGAVHIVDQEMTGIGGKKWHIRNTTIDPSGAMIEQAHMARRGSSGNVPRGRGHVILTTDAKRKAYIKQVQKRVGKLRAGWEGALNELGRSVPGWVSTAGGLGGRSGTVGRSTITSTINEAAFSGALDAKNATNYANDATGRIADAHKYIERRIAGPYFQRWIDQAIQRHNPTGTP